MRLPKILVLTIDDFVSAQFYDDVTSRYLMTTRSYTRPAGRLISIAPSGGGDFVKTGTWTLNMTDAYPPVSTRILGRRMAALSPYLTPNRVPHGFTPRS